MRPSTTTPSTLTGRPSWSSPKTGTCASMVRRPYRSSTPDQLAPSVTEESSERSSAAVGRVDSSTSPSAPRRMAYVAPADVRACSSLMPMGSWRRACTALSPGVSPWSVSAVDCRTSPSVARDSAAPSIRRPSSRVKVALLCTSETPDTAATTKTTMHICSSSSWRESDNRDTWRSLQQCRRPRRGRERDHKDRNEPSDHNGDIWCDGRHSSRQRRRVRRPLPPGATRGDMR